ncbi:MAG: AAA family ATPase [Candidatus Methanoplasma sp.]|jgi:predicted AAA+ superfamily ATPase|nr:AAA family ATPase [Candidatus Methanoplasma sp.]
MIRDIKPEGYRPRIVDSEVERKLRALGGVLIEGPKWCGKSWTGRQHAKSAANIDNTATRQVAMMEPVSVLSGDRPRLIDKWQEAPNLWDAARREIDDSHSKGMYIFTCSAVPPEHAVAHTGTGRFAKIEMLPMSLYESGDSDGSISLSRLFDSASFAVRKSHMGYSARYASYAGEGGRGCCGWMKKKLWRYLKDT